MMKEDIVKENLIVTDNLTELIAAMLAEQGGRPEVTVEASGESEMIYVVVVLVFYALAIMMLIGSQIIKKAKRQTWADENYYEEYLVRKKQHEKKVQKENILKMTGMTEPCLLEQIPEHDV